MKKKLKMRLRNEQGITLLALAVTIVILIILAGVTIGFALNDNGIIKGAKTAKEQTEIDNETSIVKRASTVAMIKSKYGTIDEASLKSALDDETGGGKTEVSDAGDYFEVMFIASNRYYQVDENGTVGEAQYWTVDEYAGDITKGGRCDGSEKKPYEISCIEDLVAFSNMSNKTGIKFENGTAVSVTSSNTFEGKYIVLTRSLNFKSKYSYADSSRTDFGNINGDDTDGNSLITEMTTGTGFTPIGYNVYFVSFEDFDGKGYSIENIWINIEEEHAVGLFGSIRGEATIKDLTVTGEIKSNWHAGGIAGVSSMNSNCIITNCTNRANITGYNMVGGIAGCYVNIENCKNYGTVTVTGGNYGYRGAGGIEGVANNNSEKEREIKNCINYGEVKGPSNLGGIVGTNSGYLVNISNCENNGNINSLEDSTYGGGIIGRQMYGTVNLLNNVNKGKINGKGSKGGVIGGVQGGGWTSEITTNISNCYNEGVVISADDSAGGIIGLQTTICAKNYINIKNSYNRGSISGSKIGSIIGNIVYNATSTETITEFENVYYTAEPAIASGTLTSGEATLKVEEEMKSQSFVNLLNSNIGENTDWNKWKLGPNGYPVFED